MMFIISRFRYLYVVHCENMLNVPTQCYHSRDRPVWLPCDSPIHQLEVSREKGKDTNILMLENGRFSRSILTRIIQSLYYALLY